MKLIKFREETCFTLLFSRTKQENTINDVLKSDYSLRGHAVRISAAHHSGDYIFVSDSTSEPVAVLSMLRRCRQEAFEPL